MRIEGLVTGELEKLGFELVKLDLSFRGRRRVLRIYIDSPDSNVTLDDCVMVTRAVGFALDGEDLVSGPYNLEVSSPGINRPLTKPEHFLRFCGRKAKVVYEMDDGGKDTLIGEIIGSDGEEITLSVDARRRSVTFGRIIKASLYDEKWEIPKKRSGKGRSGRRRARGKTL
jgi:ribosome maturation factor RimP